MSLNLIIIKSKSSTPSTSFEGSSSIYSKGGTGTHNRVGIILSNIITKPKYGSKFNTLDNREYWHL